MHQSKYGTPYIITHVKGTSGIIATIFDTQITGTPILLIKAKVVAPKAVKHPALAGPYSNFAGKLEGVALNGVQSTLAFALVLEGAADTPLMNRREAITDALAEMGEDLGFSEFHSDLSANLFALVNFRTKQAADVVKNLPAANMLIPYTVLGKKLDDDPLSAVLGTK